jgi:hypothetical protein
MPANKPESDTRAHPNLNISRMAMRGIQQPGYITSPTSDEDAAREVHSSRKPFWRQRRTAHSERRPLQRSPVPGTCSSVYPAAPFTGPLQPTGDSLDPPTVGGPVLLVPRNPVTTVHGNEGRLQNLHKPQPIPGHRPTPSGAIYPPSLWYGFLLAQYTNGGQ